MSLWSRMGNVLRGGHLNREIDEGLESHIAEAIAQGRDPVEARKAFGSALRHREGSRDVRLVTWLESLRSDAVFGWRQLVKTKITSAAAILSLALAIGRTIREHFPTLVASAHSFSTERLLILDTVAKTPQPMEFWEQTAEHLRNVPGVETVALADSPLLGWNGGNNFISVNGASPNGVLSLCGPFLRTGWMR